MLFSTVDANPITWSVRLRSPPKSSCEEHLIVNSNATSHDTMADKRGRPFNHYGNGGQNTKRQRPNESHSYGNSSSPNLFPSSRQNGASSSISSLYSGLPNKKQAKDQAEQLLNQLSRLPDPERCEPCNLAGEEMQTGLIALLDKLVAEEVVTGQEEIVHHARELQRLLSTRAAKSYPSKLMRNLETKRPATQHDPPIPTYIVNKINLSAALPPLPSIAEPHYAEAVFTHRSLTYQAQAKGLDAGDNYERLEFLGDAYIEVIASRILYSRFPQLDVPQQSQLRESLVKNETLGRFAEAYCFGDRLKHGGHMDKGKAWDKICADVFEAYIAAIVLSSPEGFSIAERWLLEFKERMIENPKAREDLQRLVVGKGIKLNYREVKAMETINGIQNYHIGVYLTGWGFEDEWLGSGQGQNKAQASVEAAQDAIGRSEEVGVIPVANRKKLEMYPLKPREEESKKEDSAVARGGDLATKTDDRRDSSPSTEKRKKKKKKHAEASDS
jgi:ribonuclease-3